MFLKKMDTKDIPDNEVWAGFPAKKVKDNNITDV